MTGQLQGLFTAHVTGNFVTLGASLVLGTSGVFAKLLALPVFCVVVVAVRLLATLLSKFWRPVFEILIGFKVLLLTAGAALAISFGPFHDGDSRQAVLTGMVLVAAMAIQNAVHRIYLGSAPPSTLMTGTTTQIMIDLADVIVRGGNDGQASARSSKMMLNVLMFAIGCGAAALLFALRNVVLYAAAGCARSSSPYGTSYREATRLDGIPVRAIIIVAKLASRAYCCCSSEDGAKRAAVTRTFR